MNPPPDEDRYLIQLKRVMMGFALGFSALVVGNLLRVDALAACGAVVASVALLVAGALVVRKRLAR